MPRRMKMQKKQKNSKKLLDSKKQSTFGSIFSCFWIYSTHVHRRYPIWALYRHPSSHIQCSRGFCGWDNSWLYRRDTREKCYRIWDCCRIPWVSTWEHGTEGYCWGYHEQGDPCSISDSTHTRDICEVPHPNTSGTWIFPLESCHKTPRKKELWTDCSWRTTFASSQSHKLCNYPQGFGNHMRCVAKISEAVNRGSMPRWPDTVSSREGALTTDKHTLLAKWIHRNQEVTMMDWYTE